MSSVCHWHREAIGCHPSSRISGYVVSSEPKCSRVPSIPSCFQSEALRSKTRFRVDGRVSDRRVLWRQLYGSFTFGWSVHQNGRRMSRFTEKRRMHSIASQVFSVLPALPFAAAAVALSRVASIMAILGDEFQSRKTDLEIRKGDNLAEEFVEASKGNRPWRPGLEKALTQQGSLSLALLSASALAQDHLNPVIATLRANPTFMSGLVAWTIAQAAKVFTYYLVVRKWDFKMVMGSGGMPSSHSALCFALTTSVAIAHGVSDALFPVCLGFTLIVMYDAAGVRRHAGRQAEVLNLIVEDFFQGHPVSERKLKELLGHTPLQVFAGAALGILVGYLCSRPRLT